MKYLKSYKEKEMLGYFTDGRTIYELEIIEVCFFGLIKRNKTIDYTLKYDEPASVFLKHWDKMIEDKKPVKNTKISLFDCIGLLLVIILVLPIIWTINFIYELLTN